MIAYQIHRGLHTPEDARWETDTVRSLGGQVYCDEGGLTWVLFEEPQPTADPKAQTRTLAAAPQGWVFVPPPLPYLILEHPTPPKAVAP